MIFFIKIISETNRITSIKIKNALKMSDNFMSIYLIKTNNFMIKLDRAPLWIQKCYHHTKIQLKTPRRSKIIQIIF